MTPYKTLTSILAALMLPAIFACLWASPVFAQLTVTVRKTTDTPLPERVDYESSPFMAVGSIVPHVMIVMAKNLKMFQHGYPGLTDLDGDGRADTGFNPSVEYVGYFDSRSCYKYMGKDFVSLSRTYYATGDTTGYFVRVGPTKEDESESTINASRPSGLKSYVVSPRSKTGICNDPNQSAATRTFSGNWLNYITTSRMDAIRRILYGGTRVEDTATRTMLVGSFVPPDSTTWGSEVRSDDTWQEITPLNAYFDVRKYTIYDKPKSKTAHFFARGSDLGTYNNHFPAIRVLLNANAASFNEGGYDSVSVKVTITKPYPRYWDWVLVNRPLPDDMVLKSEAIRKSIKIYNIRVLACEPGNMGEGEGCRRYPGTTESEADDVWKPSGLLQKYGEGSSPMYFGLITGTYGNNLRKQGGMLRAQMGPVQGLPPANSNVFVPSVDLRTGQFIEKGLIRNIDYLRISGKPLNLEPTTFATNGSAGYKNTYSWYNPLGEMTYEAARYLAGSQSPTTLFSNDSDKDDGETNSSIYKLTQFRSTDGGGKAWTLRRPELPTALCFKPVILLISDITTDYDGDNLGTDLKRGLLPSVKLPTGISQSDVPDLFNKDTYLNTISKLEGFNNSGVQYYFSESSTDSCTPKTLTSGLKQVKGVCPSGMASEGTYSAAAVSYYAHIHNFNTNSEGSPTSVDVYAVTMSSTFPELTFPVRDSTGKVVKSVSLNPVNTSGSVQSGRQLMGILNYFILDWDVDRHGLAFHVTIKVNFSDYVEGDDWEGDGQVTYDVSLLTDASTPTSMRETTAASIDSGDPAMITGKTWYKFKNPDTADKTSDFISIDASQVKGILIHSEWSQPGTGVGLAMGYTITGTTRDGTYLGLTMNTPAANTFLTPKGCPYAGAPSTGTYGCGKSVQNIKTQDRVFAFRDNSSEFQALPNPLWLAAKYGGFNDINHNGVPDTGEWEGPDGNPSNYFQATNIAELPQKLETAFQTIARSLSTGTATSASVDTILGGGVSLHTIYYPEYQDASDGERQIHWVGSVYGLFVDRWGNLREDSDGDKTLTVANGATGSEGDYVVTFHSTKNELEIKPDCYLFGEFVSRCYDPYGTNHLFLTASNPHPNIHRINALFDTGKWLSRLDATLLATGPRPWGQAATSSNGRRRIYFGYIPIGSSATLPSLELFDKEPGAYAKLLPQLLYQNFQEVLPGFNTKEEATQALIGWIQGSEHTLLRGRTVSDPWSDTGRPVVWRLGDVINSKPIIVGLPASNYDLLYGDLSYTEYKNSNILRRQMAYFGANDGMLHAINLGFQGTLAQGSVTFTEEPQTTTGPPPSVAKHEIGAEIWAYIPTSLLPHLQWLASKEYTHAYYVDLKPQINDVKINGKWRTVLIGGLRLGGRPIQRADMAAQLAGGSDPNYYAEVFCLDISDPEKEPTLLWRHSSLSQGLTVGQPITVANQGKFYAVIPSGPVTDSVDMSTGIPTLTLGENAPFFGHSNQKARLIVIDFETGNEVDAASNVSGYLTAEEPNSFFNNPFLPVASERKTPWNNHVLYFGLTQSREPSNCEDSGAIYRLQMADLDGKPLGVASWRLKRLYNTGRPVTGAVNSAYDKRGNLWVVFGTGRLWSADDLSPCITMPSNQKCLINHDQYLFGIKEELGTNGFMTFSDRSASSKILDVSGAKVYASGNVQGMPTSSIMTWGSGGTTTTAAVENLTTSNKVDGYKRKLATGELYYPNETHRYEMVLTQPKLLAMGGGKSLVSFTTFEPTEEGCGSAGYGYLHLLNTFTGLPDPSTYSFFYAGDTPPLTSMPKDLVLGAITTGQGNPTEAYIQMSASGITVSAADQEAGIYSMHLPMESDQGSGVVSWKEVLDVGFQLPKEVVSQGLTD